MLKIGSYKLPSNVLLAPMAGVTDLPFRLICRKYGAKFAFFEMIDMNSIIHGKKKDLPAGRHGNDIIKTDKKDKPIAVQLVGAEPELMLKAAKQLLKILDVKFLDINAACPVRKMMKKKAGAYLIKEPENLYKTIKLLSDKLDLPITVKLRTGFTNKDDEHIVRIAMNCEKAGAKAIFIHGRTQKQGYGGEVDLEAIKAVKKAVSIPVFGSGNIFSPELAKKMLDETGCDGVLVARGAYGNPWIFNEIAEYLKNGNIAPKKSVKERMKALKEHLTLISKYRNMHPDSIVGYMRKVAQWYLRDFPGACTLRRTTNHVKTYEQLVEVINRSEEIIRTA